MTDDISVIITGDRDVELRFDEFPDRLRDTLRERISGLTDELAARVRGAVPKRTGKLAGEIVDELRETPDEITGIVTLSGEFAKAAALEYGGTGETFSVRAHDMRLDHLWGRAASLVVSVPEHGRSRHDAARRFLRGPLEAMRGEVVASLNEAVQTTAAA